MKKEKSEFFSPQRRFSDTINSHHTIVLDKDCLIFGKALRTGAVLRIIGTRDVENSPYLIVSKGTWESLILYADVIHLIKQINE